MPDDRITMTIDGVERSVPRGWTVAAAVLDAGRDQFRTSIAGAARGPVCGMGVCFECRVTIDGVANVRACAVTCRDRMEVRTDA